MNEAELTRLALRGERHECLEHFRTKEREARQRAADAHRRNERDYANAQEAVADAYHEAAQFISERLSGVA